VGEDFANRERIAKLLRFPPPRRQRRAERVARRLHRAHEGRAGQDLLRDAETFLAAKNSPHLEIFRKRGIEVLLLSERVDEWLVANLAEHEGRALASVAKASSISPSSSRRGEEGGGEAATGHRALVAKLKDALGDR